MVRRFVLQMEAPLDPETFDPVAVRDQMNNNLPYSEVIGVGRSRQGNLIITCRSSATAVLKYQRQWLPQLPPVRRIHDEERWVRRVVRIHGPTPISSPADMSPGRIERELCGYNSIKLAATRRLITDSIVLLFFEREADARKISTFSEKVSAQ